MSTLSGLPVGLSTFVLASPFTDADLGVFATVREMGYDLVEVCVEAPARLTAGALVRAGEESGLRMTVCGAFGPDRDVSHEDPVRRKEAVAYLRHCVDVAADVASPIVGGPMYAPTGQARLLPDDERERQRSRAAESLREVADYAGERGVRLAVEPLNRFETDLVNTVEQGLDLCARVSRDNVGLLLDTFHMNIEEKHLGEAIRTAGDRVFHFQVSENDRGTPGTGHVAWDEAFGALDDIGYTGCVVVESFLPTVAEIADAVSLWRPVAASMDELAREGLRFVRSRLNG